MDVLEVIKYETLRLLGIRLPKLNLGINRREEPSGNISDTIVYNGKDSLRL